MGLRLAGVTRRRESSVEQFRMRLPKSAVRLHGKTMLLTFAPVGDSDPVVFKITIGHNIRCSLRTTDRQVAMRRGAELRAQLERYFAAAGSQPVPLTQHQRVGLAGIVYRTFWEAHRDNPEASGALETLTSKTMRDGLMDNVNENDWPTLGRVSQGQDRMRLGRPLPR